MKKTLLFLTLIYVCIGIGSSIERNLSQQKLRSEHHAITQRSLHGEGSSKTPKSKSSKSSKTPKSKGGKGGKGGKGSSKAPKASKANKRGKGGKGGTNASSSKSPKSSKTPKSSKSPKSTKYHGGKGGKGGKGHNAPTPSPDGGNGKPTVDCTGNLRSIVEAIFGNISSGTYQEDALVWLQSDLKDNVVKCNDSSYITQRYALATLHYSTGGSNWINTNGWLGRGDECDSWFGVICDDNNQVTKLALPTNNLTGILPEELFAGITTFTSIEIFSNNLSGGIPSGIGNSPLRVLDIEKNNFSGNLFIEEIFDLSGSLEELFASFNGFTGSIPSRISKFENLKSLWLARNEFSGAIPTQIGALSSMERLYLYGNKFDGQIPTEIGNLSKLRKLHLYSNTNMSGPIPASIGNLGKLEDLELDTMGLTGNIPDSIQNLSELKTIRAFENDLTGAIPAEIRKLKKLVTVELHNNSLNGDIPDLSESTNLKRLDLSSNELNGQLDAKLFEMPNLRLLYLFENKLIGGIPVNFGGSTSLRDIYLYDNLLTGEIPDVVDPSLSNLEELIVSQNKIGGVVPSGICGLRSTNLDTLRVDCTPLSGQPPQVVCAQNCCTSCRIGKGAA